MRKHGPITNSIVRSTHQSTVGSRILGLGQKLQSLTQGLTKGFKKARRFGVVVKSDGSTIVLEEPKPLGYVNEDGGLFWVVKHKGGVYKVQASALHEYNELESHLTGAGAATIIQGGVY